MWFFFALLTALMWGGADLFYKKGTDEKDKYSHLKIIVCVGVVMGIHATVYWILNRGDISFSAADMLKYLPVSFLYILSMALGYVGLRYLELSISSPVQNSSGAISVILCLIFFTQIPNLTQITGIVLVFAGIMGIGILDKIYEERARSRMEADAEKKYRTGFVALIFPVLYCIIDALGTFADGLYLDEYEIIGENEALLAYEYTFFICAVIVFIFLKVKKQKFSFSRDKDKGIAAVLETAGQFFYVFSMAENSIISATLVSSYCVISVIFSRIFLKEKLRPMQYVMIVAVFIGIGAMALGEGV